MSARLKKTYAAFVQKCGSELAAAMANSFGSTNGSIADVPPARADGLANALTRIMGGGAITMNQIRAITSAASEPEPESSQDDAFAAIRKKAFRKPAADDTDSPQKVAAVLDPSAIYARWNSSKRSDS